MNQNICLQAVVKRHNWFARILYKILLLSAKPFFQLETFGNQCIHYVKHYV